MEDNIRFEICDSKSNTYLDLSMNPETEISFFLPNAYDCRRTDPTTLELLELFLKDRDNYLKEESKRIIKSWKDLCKKHERTIKERNEEIFQLKIQISTLKDTIKIVGGKDAKS